MALKKRLFRVELSREPDPCDHSADRMDLRHHHPYFRRQDRCRHPAHLPRVLARMGHRPCSDDPQRQHLAPFELLNQHRYKKEHGNPRALFMQCYAVTVSSLIPIMRPVPSPPYFPLRWRA